MKAMKTGVRKVVKPRRLALLALAAVLAGLGRRRPHLAGGRIPLANPAPSGRGSTRTGSTPQLVRRRQLHLQGRRLRRLPRRRRRLLHRRRHPRRQQQPAGELQRRAGVLLLVEGRRDDATRRSRTASSAVRHGEGPPLQHAELAAQRRRADDPRRGCAGQQVMLASHNDCTPVSTNHGSGPASGSPTPMSTMHSGNWGNGSAYDANMGENMNLEELGSVLRWHESTARTRRGRSRRPSTTTRRAASSAPATTRRRARRPPSLAAPAAAGDTNIKVTSTRQPAARQRRSRSTRSTPRTRSSPAVGTAGDEHDARGGGRRRATRTIEVASVSGDRRRPRAQDRPAPNIDARDASPRSATGRGPPPRCSAAAAARRHEHQGRLDHEHGRRRAGRDRRGFAERRVRHHRVGRHGGRGRDGRNARRRRSRVGHASGVAVQDSAAASP